MNLASIKHRIAKLEQAKAKEDKWARKCRRCGALEPDMDRAHHDSLGYLEGYRYMIYHYTAPCRSCGAESETGERCRIIWGTPERAFRFYASLRNDLLDDDDAWKAYEAYVADLVAKAQAESEAAQAAHTDETNSLRE